MFLCFALHKLLDKYGYTGTSSPFVALYEAIKQGRVKRGDYVFMATSAAGGMYITELIKYQEKYK